MRQLICIFVSLVMLQTLCFVFETSLAESPAPSLRQDIRDANEADTAADEEAAIIEDDLPDAEEANSAIKMELSLVSCCIPDSTPLISSGVILHGLITYEYVVQAKVAENGKPYVGQSILWRTDGSTSENRYITGTLTDSSGIARAAIHARSPGAHGVTAAYQGASQKTTIHIGSAASYKSSLTEDTLPPEAQKIWWSADGTLCGAAAEEAQSGNLQVVVTRSDRSTRTEALALELPTLAKSVEEVRFPAEDQAVVISHINPSLNLYQIFDLETGEPVEEYWGCGFVSDGDILYYVQAPQHFSGLRGSNRILTSAGDLLYESGENAMISSELTIAGDTITFYEKDLLAGETVQRSCSASAALRTGDVSYYE